MCAVHGVRFCSAAAVISQPMGAFSIQARPQSSTRPNLSSEKARELDCDSLELRIRDIFAIVPLHLPFVGTGYHCVGYRYSSILAALNCGLLQRSKSPNE